MGSTKRREGEKSSLLRIEEKRKSDAHSHRVTPLIERSPWMRLDVYPFLVLYGFLLFIDQERSQPSVHDIFRELALPIALMSHLFFVLLQQWFVNFRCWVGYKRASQSPNIIELEELWTHCLVESPSLGETAVDSGIVPVRYEEAGSGSQLVAIVVFHDISFRASGTIDEEMDGIWFNAETNGKINLPPPRYNDALFHRLQYPTNLPLSSYRNTWSKGHSSLKTAKRSHQVYGNNTTNILLPSFFDLLGPQLLAPFFLFQIFCVVLWSLDEYWYYALFTLLALLLFESTVAFNRLKSLERLRGTLRHEYQVLTYRYEKWMYLETNELVPGDVISLSSTNTRGEGENIHVPADLLLLSGSAVVDEALLTGESAPQRKNALDMSSSTDRLDMMQEHKESILFAGSILESHDTNSEGHDDDTQNKASIILPPNGGIRCLVLKTGFETMQGSLLRTMTHSSRKSTDGIHTQDTFVFVAILLICAVLSAISVLNKGWEDETRNRFRLILHVVIIVTSVVPPELPMELSLAVTNSVADLMRHCRVFCTEPFRIPWAGQVTICCFDKTGTLTSDEMQLKGVRLLPMSHNKEKTLMHPSKDDIPWETLRVMIGCQSLSLKADGERLLGDPLERAVLQDTGFGFIGNNQILVPMKEPKYSQAQRILIHHRFQFSSRLKRMTVLLTEGNTKTVHGVTKGAPETIKGLLLSAPSQYDQVYRYHMQLGQRVLAMAYRSFDSSLSLHALKKLGREELEKNLIFAGFLILECPLKPDSKSVITELKESGHKSVMITGDATLTAVEVSRQVGIITATKTFELRCREDCKKNVIPNANAIENFEFVPLESSKSDTLHTISLSRSNLTMIRKMKDHGECSFCVSGSVMSKLGLIALRGASIDHSVLVSSNEGKNILLHPVVQNVLKELVQIISVYARHAPRQKEAIVAAYNLAGEYTMMTGDGTNDVGALKRAHVGISIISAPKLEAKQRTAKANIMKEQKKERKALKEGKVKKKKNRKLEESMRLIQETQNELDQVELGDASVASPFTSRSMSIKCCKDVLQQGRCTLVTMLTIYKILGVNCLVNALVLTKLHTYGVKQGDRQLTIIGIIVAGLFLFVTRGRPLNALSRTRPPASVMCSQALLSIAVQFFIHFSCIIIATDVSLTFVDPYDPSTIPDASFNPNVLNSCTFLLTILATVNTFLVNYRGRPFMQDLQDNKLLWKSCQACYSLLFACSFEVFPPLNDLLQLAPFPDTNIELAVDDEWLAVISTGGYLVKFVQKVGFPSAMSIIMIVNIVLTLVVDRLVLKIFEF